MSSRDLLTTAAKTSVGVDHAVQFYESDEALVDTVAALLEERARSQEIELSHRKVLETVLREALADRRRAEEALRQELAERENVEAELRKTKEEAERASAAKSEFLAVMSHELRTPLNAIMGYEQLLSQGIAGKPNAKQLQFLQRIRLSAMHLLGLINDILNLARIEAGTLAFQLENVWIADVLRAVEPIVEPQLLEKSLKYSADLQSGLVAQADRERVQQILVNLLTNAMKFTPEGGTISVAARSLPQDEHWIEIDVSDTGPGIPAAKHAAIFERFVQLDTGRSRRSSGAGLGLSISRDLARGMSGDLTVKSVPGAGSTFTLVLPRAATVVQSLPAPT
jgi:signal transduction histidine kinase